MFDYSSHSLNLFSLTINYPLGYATQSFPSILVVIPISLQLINIWDGPQLTVTFEPFSSTKIRLFGRVHALSFLANLGKSWQIGQIDTGNIRKLRDLRPRFSAKIFGRKSFCRNACQYLLSSCMYYYPTGARVRRNRY